MDAIISNDNAKIEVDGSDAPRKPLVNSFEGYISYSVSFFFAILCWFVAGAGLYDMLSRVSAMYTMVYIIWAIPLLGLFVSIFTGTSTLYWRASIFGWTFLILIAQAFRTLFYGFNLETSPLMNFFPSAPAPIIA